MRRKIADQDTSHLDSEPSFLDSTLPDISQDGVSGPHANGFGLGSTGTVPSDQTMFIDPALQGGDTGAGADPYMAQTRESSAGVGSIAFNELQNPSDALGILAQIASNGENAPTYGSSIMRQHNANQTSLDYALVRNGKLSLPKIIQLLQRYKYYYHPYFPLVPAATLDAGNLAKTAQDEKHLLTAILVIASRDLTDEPSIFLACSEHMRSLVSALAAGGSANVEAVEALLLLAEWTPYTSRSDAGHVGRGEEDREAWM